MGLTKPCTTTSTTQLHPPPPSSIHLHPAPPSSIHLHPTHFNLPPALSTSIHLHPAHFSLHQLSATDQQYFDQNIARNWAVSPNFGRKTKSCPFWLKISTYGILEELIPNPDLDLWNFDPKINFWANLSQKSQSCLFYLKIGIYVILKFLILVPILVFWISKSKSIFGQIRIGKLKVVQFDWKLAHRVSRRCWFLFQH